MAEEKTPNELFHLAVTDISNIDAWAARDEKICRKRLTERKAKRNKPYPGAPNGVVPIVDDTTREKTDQEISMLANSRYFAHFIPLTEKMQAADLSKAQIAFDTYLRYIINAMPKIESALDTKNARGFCVIKIIRTNHDRYGMIPDFEPRDIRQIVVPTHTTDIQKAERITDLLPGKSPRAFEAELESHPTWYKDVGKDILAKCTSTDELSGDKHIKGTLGSTADLLGITTGGKSNKEIKLWEQYVYADDWIVGQDRFKRVKKGQKCKILYSPRMPENLLSVEPWRDEDVFEYFDPARLVQEMKAAAMEGREPKTGESKPGKERAWPFIQPRFENRSLAFYDSRGVGQLCMDDQLFATAELNAKMVMMDYFQLPLFTGSGSRGSTNISHEPGSYLPDGVSAVQMPSISPQFDFDIERHKRDAARRSGALSQYEFSGDLSSKKRVQKTAREIDEESMRGTMLSSASVDRFNNPWAEVFMQLWEDLGRLEVKLPMIQQRRFRGQMDLSIYKWPVMIVPASSAKTFNPEAQFNRDTTAWNFAAASLAPMGVTLDPEAAAIDILSHWDPFKAERWIKSNTEKGPDGQQPVYQQLQALTQAVQAIGEKTEAIEKLAVSLAKAGGGQ